MAAGAFEQVRRMPAAGSDQLHARNVVEGELRDQEAHPVSRAGKVEGIKAGRIVLEKFFPLRVVLGDLDPAGAQIDLHDALDIRAEIVGF